MALTDTKIRSLKPRSATYRVADSHGLAIEVQPSGTKAWRYRYRHLGKANMLGLGNYPVVPLSEARRLRDDARQLLVRGADPSVQRKLARSTRMEGAGNTFAAIALEWFAKNEPRWTEGNIKRTRRLFGKDLFPWIGQTAIAEVGAPLLLSTLRRIEDRGALETAHRTRALVGQVFRYAIATGRADRDPSLDLRGALPAYNKKHFASITEPRKVGELLRTLDGYTGHFPTRCALLLAPLLFVRPGNLRKAEWKEFDLDAAEWRIPAEKMKSRRPHIVPLAHQAMSILRDLQAVTGYGRYLFPSVRVAAD